MSEIAPGRLCDALAHWAAELGAWEQLVRHDPRERVCALLHRDEELELYLICWMPGHDTGFHDHDDSAAAITVLAGCVSEERFGLRGTVGGTIRTGETVTIAREAIHRVRHAGEVPAVTLHAYSPPLSRVGTYELAKDGTLLRHPRASDTTLISAAA